MRYVPYAYAGFLVLKMPRTPSEQIRWRLGLLSPVTTLFAEFEVMTIEAALQSMELTAHAARLAPTNVWTIIGDEDRACSQTRASRP